MLYYYFQWKAPHYPSRRRCATKVFRRAFRQKLGSAPVTSFFQWAVITPFHFSVRYKQKGGGTVHFSPLASSLACTTSHPGSGFQSNTPSVPQAHRAFLNVLIQELKRSKAWGQAKARPHHFWGPPGCDCCLAHAVTEQLAHTHVCTPTHGTEQGKDKNTLQMLEETFCAWDSNSATGIFMYKQWEVL